MGGWTVLANSMALAKLLAAVVALVLADTPVVRKMQQRLLVSNEMAPGEWGVRAR